MFKGARNGKYADEYQSNTEIENETMKYQLNERIESILAGIRPSLGGADILLKGVNEGIVTLEYRRALSNPSACHVDRTKTSKEIIIETIQDEFKMLVPDFKKIIVIGED